MALTDKKYERIFSETGSDGDLVTADEKALMKKEFDDNTYIEDKDAVIRLGPVLWQLQKITEELDYLRTEISTNKDKTGITSQQTNTITANEKSVASHASSITSLTNDMKAVQKNLTVTTDSGIEAKFENLKVGLKSSTIDLKIVDNNGKSPQSYKATITLQ